MSTFTNISGDDRDVQVDGRRIHVPAGENFTVPDIHDDSLVEQPHFEIVGEDKPKRSRKIILGEPTDEEITPENAAHLVDHEGTGTVGEFSAATIATAEAPSE